MKIAIIDADGIITDICSIERGVRPSEYDDNDDNIYEFDDDLRCAIQTEIESFPFHDFPF